MMSSATILLVVLLTILNNATASPAPSSPIVKYDQRQEGDWNVRADLENFVILVIPSSAAGLGGGGGGSVGAVSTATGASLGLLDLLTKAVPFRGAGMKRKHHHTRRYHHQQQSGDVMPLETQHFIESKTAPYHVDITRSANNLARLHPEDLAKSSPSTLDEVVIAQSPPVALKRSRSLTLPILPAASTYVYHPRLSRAYLVSVPLETEEASHRLLADYNPSAAAGVSKKKKKPSSSLDTAVDAKNKKDTGVKSKDKVVSQKLALIGAEHEQCGPGQDRDAAGICRTIV